MVFACSALALASCSDSDSDGGGGSPFASNDDPDPSVESPFSGLPDSGEPVESPSTEVPPAEQPPVEQSPVEQPPIQQPPVEQPPVGQPPAEQPSGDALSLLFGQVTFTISFDDGDGFLRFSTEFSEANRRQDPEDGTTFLQVDNSGQFAQFNCLAPDDTAEFFCFGIFSTGGLALLAFELQNGAGAGPFEECAAEDLQFEGGVEDCFEDFARTPDGSVQVAVSNAAQTARPEAGEFIESVDAFEPTMIVNGQATRFGVFHTRATDEERARMSELLAAYRSVRR